MIARFRSALGRGFLASTIVALLASTPDSARAQLAGAGFGGSTGIAGETVAVGEPNSLRRPGTVYLYRAGGDGWEEAGRLVASDGTPGDRFGEALVASGDRLVVGASRADGGRGAAYVFELRDGTWVETAKLSDPEGEPGAMFGISVAMENELITVATEDGAVLSWVGVVEGFVGPASLDLDAPAVHAFRLGADSSWRPAGRLSPGAGEAGIGFGHAMLVHEGAVFVGAEKRNGSTGAVLVFEAGDGGWEQTSEIIGTVAGAGFGASLAITDSGQLMIGAPVQDGQQGEVYAYARDVSGGWSEAARLRPEGGGVGHFGAAVAAAGDEVLIAALGSGFAARFDPAEGTWSESVELDVEQGTGTSFFATKVAAADGVGSVGFAEDDFGAGSSTILRRSGNVWSAEALVVGELDGMEAVGGNEVRCREGSAADFDCESVDLLAFVPTSDLGSARGVQVNDIWGWTDAETGHEYALVGRNDGTAFVDISDPGNPVYVGQLPRTEGSPSAGWRDVKTYQNYALIVADGSGAHGMQVFDLNRLRGVTDAPATFEPDATYGGFGSSHNIIVNEASAFAYAVTGQCGGGLHMIDLSNPLDPQGAGCYTHTGNSPLDSFTHDSQCVAYSGPDTEHQGREICFTSGIMGLLISDMTDHDDVATLAVGQIPDQALPHQGWLTEDHRYFLLGDEGDELQGVVDRTRTLIWDVTDLDDPVLLSEYFGPTRAVDHNMYVRGNLVYQANYDAGLRIIDISNIAAPREVGYFDTVPQSGDEPSFRLGAWSVYPYFESGVIIVSSGGEGLFVLRYRPEEPVS